jgi:glucosamine 6-phosphate synthetase-like amidotransferase/phosphosugar isomerase protein
MKTGYIDERSIEWELRNAEPYYMGDAIEAIPATIEACLEMEFLSKLQKGLENVKPERIYAVGTGTSYNVCEAIAYFCRKYLNVKAEACDALDFELDTPLELDANSMVISLSHSGNTLATGLAVEKARKLGAFTVGISAVAGSRLPQTADFGLIDPNPYEGRPRGKTRSYHSSIILGILISLLLPRLVGQRVCEEKEGARRSVRIWNFGKMKPGKLPQWVRPSRYILAGFGCKQMRMDRFGSSKCWGKRCRYSLEELTHGQAQFP